MLREDKGVVRRFEKAQDRLVLQASDMSLETIATMVEQNAIDTQPLYQRRERWSLGASSRLIESFLLNIPVPPVYLAEEAYGQYSVIDGKQRLTTIRRFMRNEFSLKGVQHFGEIEMKKFNELPLELQNALRIRPYIRVVTLLRQSDPELKYQVFTRLNTGGETLEPQEIRNAAFRGKLNDLLFALSASPFLTNQLKIKNKREPTYLRMLDVEYVLRFFTVASTWKNFSGDYRKSMDLYMEEHRNPTEEFLQGLMGTFEECLTRCEKLWGTHAFKRYDGSTFRNQFLAGMYDAQMVAVNQLTHSEFDQALVKKDRLLSRTKLLFGDKKFDTSVRVGTNTKSSIEYRITKLSELLLGAANKD